MRRNYFLGIGEKNWSWKRDLGLKFQTWKNAKLNSAHIIPTDLSPFKSRGQASILGMLDTVTTVTLKTQVWKYIGPMHHRECTSPEDMIWNTQMSFWKVTRLLKWRVNFFFFQITHKCLFEIHTQMSFLKLHTNIFVFKLHTIIF